MAGKKRLWKTKGIPWTTRGTRRTPRICYKLEIPVRDTGKEHTGQRQEGKRGERHHEGLNIKKDKNSWDHKTEGREDLEKISKRRIMTIIHPRRSREELNTKKCQEFNILKEIEGDNEQEMEGQQDEHDLGEKTRDELESRIRNLSKKIEGQERNRGMNPPQTIKGRGGDT